MCTLAKDGETSGKNDLNGKKHCRANPEAVFKKWDANSDGSVTKDEFIAARTATATKRGLEESSKEILEKRFTEIDANSDGALTMDELKNAFAKTKEKHGKQKNGKQGKADGNA